MWSSSRLWLAVPLLLSVPAFCGPLLNVPITGTLNFSGFGSTNYFDPANGYVPAGAPNSASPTVTITSPGIAFQYLNSFSGIDVSFLDDLSFSVAQFPVGGGGNANSWTITLSGLSPAITGLAQSANTFPGLGDSFTSSSVTLTFGGGTLGAGGWLATYDLTAVPEPGTLVLLGLGLAILAARRLRR